MTQPELTLDEYVDEHREDLIELVLHGSDLTVRSLCMSALIEGGEEPDLEQVQAEFAELHEEVSG